jgi:hypothetical protein
MQVATRDVTNGKGRACVHGMRLEQWSSSAVKLTRTTGRYMQGAVQSTEMAGLLQAAGRKFHAVIDSHNICA